MSLIDRILNWDRLPIAVTVTRDPDLDMLQIVRRQNALLTAHEREIARLKLEYSKWGRTMIEKFIEILDRPEDQDDLRPLLHEALDDMNREVARLGEHVA